MAGLLGDPVPGDTDNQVFWGFFIVAARPARCSAALAGYIAYRALKAGSPPAPQMAIEEAKLIKETVTVHPTPRGHRRPTEARR